MEVWLVSCTQIQHCSLAVLWKLLISRRTIYLLLDYTPLQEKGEKTEILSELISIFWMALRAPFLLFSEYFSCTMMYYQVIVLRDIFSLMLENGMQIQTIHVAKNYYFSLAYLSKCCWLLRHVWQSPWCQVMGSQYQPWSTLLIPFLLPAQNDHACTN